MRLGSCIAIELVAGALTLSAAAWSVAFAAGAIRGDATPAREPLAVVAPAPGPAVVASTDDVAIDRPPIVDAGTAAGDADLDPIWVFIDQPDDALLAPLRAGTIARVKFNGGGTSLSMRLEFEDGSKAAFKPDQIHRHSDPRKEIAAYRIDRLLHLGRVAPAIARSFSMRELSAKIASTHREHAHRLAEEAVPRNGTLRGELSWWIPELGAGYIENRYKIDSREGINRWKQWLTAGAEMPADEVPMLVQLSNVTAFDFLVDNLDRWSGGNANTTADGTTLYYMDNTMAFSLEAAGHKKNRTQLERVQVFSRGLVARLRKLDEPRLRALLAPDTGPYEQLLTDPELAALLARRDALIAYIDDLIARHGEAKVLAFP